MLGLYFKIEISGFFSGFLRQRYSEVKSQYFLKLTNKQLYEISFVFFRSHLVKLFSAAIQDFMSNFASTI